MTNYRSRLSEQLNNYLEELRNKVDSENYNPEILSVIRKLSDLSQCLEIDLEGVLRQEKKKLEKSNVKIFHEILDALDHLINSFVGKNPNMDSSVLYGSNKFIIARQEEINSLVDEIVKEIQEAINRNKEESQSWQKKTAYANEQRQELEDKYNKLQQEYEIQEKYKCKDYQLILEKIGSNPLEKTEQQIKHIVENALKDINVDVLWKQPEGDNGKYFLIQNDSKITKSGVVRPCLVQNSNVIQIGIIIKPI